MVPFVTLSISEKKKEKKYCNEYNSSIMWIYTISNERLVNFSCTRKISVN